MARAQLRADQIRDPDVLTEAEHLALVHQNLTTSGTLTVDNASVTGFTIEYSNDDIVLTNTDPDGDVYIKATNASSQVKTGIHIQPDASTALYHAGVAAARTYGNGGLQYFKQGAAGTSGYIYDKSGVGFTMQSATGETIAFHHVNEPMAVFTADGAIKLYHDGSLALETTTTTGIDVTGEVTATTYYGDGSNLTGISSGSFDPTTVSGLYFNDSEVASSDANGIATQQITDGDNYITLDDSANRIEIFTAGNKMVQIDNLFTIEHGDGNKGLEVAASYIDFYGATAARRFQLYPHDTLTRFVNTANSSEMVFQSNNSSSVQKDMLRLDPDGYSILSYAGDTRFYTDIDGVSLSANGTYLAVVCDEHAYITNSYNGGSISLQGDNSSNVRKYVFIGYPDDYSAMFHAGAKVLSTVTSGIRVHRADDPKGLDIIMGTSDCTITNREHGGLIIIQSEDGAGAAKDLIKADPSGSVELNHAGTKKVETADYGLSFGANTISGTGDIYCNDIYTSSGTVHIGNTALSSNGATLLVDGQPIAGTGIQSGCSVKLSTDQTVTAQTTEQIEFNTELFDLNNEFNTSTYKFTAKQAGYYLVSLHHLYQDGVPLDDYFTATVRKNGNTLWRSKLPPGDSRTITGIDITGVVELQIDDYIDATTYHHNVTDKALSDETNIFIWRLNSTPVDLQNYYTKSEVDATISGLEARIEALEQA